MREIQVEAKNVQLAVEKALKELVLRRDQVEVVVLNEGSSGFLGIGAKQACVVVREKKWTGEHKPGKDTSVQRKPDYIQREHKRPPAPRRPAREQEPRHETRRQEERPAAPQPVAQQAPAPRPQTPAPAAAAIATVEAAPAPEEMKPVIEDARTTVSQILTLSGVPFTAVRADWDSRQARIYVEFDSESGSMFTGKDPRVLEALQFIVTLIVSRKNKVPVAVQVDTQNYWKRMEGELMDKLARAVETVKRTGRPYRMEPMSPSLRRFVHKALAADSEVETMSEGESKWRKIVIRPASRGRRENN